MLISSLFSTFTSNTLVYQIEIFILSKITLPDESAFNQLGRKKFCLIPNYLSFSQTIYLLNNWKHSHIREDTVFALMKFRSKLKTGYTSQSL